MREYTYEDCVIGLKENFQVQVTDDMVDDFRELSGDRNPLHNDAQFAKEKGFKGKVVYGMLTASFLSTLAGMYLPGKHCLIQEVSLKFVKPVYIGEKLMILGEVQERNELFNQLVLKVRISNETGENVLRGKMHIGILGNGEGGVTYEKSIAGYGSFVRLWNCYYKKSA